MLVAAVGLSASANSQVAQAISAPPGHYNVLFIAPGGTGAGINNFGQVLLGFGNENIGSAVSLWTPTVANSGSSGNLVSVSGPLTYMVAGGVNDCGQVTFGPDSQFNGGVTPYLWSPDTPNGSAGTARQFLDDIDSGPYGFWVYPQTLRINAFGQISGQIYFMGPQHPTQFLWTPFQANGSRGTSNTDPRLMGIVAINDFGQAIVSGGVLYGSELTASLFTPSIANGGSGTFTSIPGLPGAATTSLADINGIGTIVGWSCPNFGSGNQCQTFVWVPTSPNSPSGTTAGIPIPTGFSAMVPAAINSLGDIVGTLADVGGGNSPFLYTGGAVYDLSALSNQLVGATPTGINDAGQIAVNTAGGAYLLTPGRSTGEPGPGQWSFATPPERILSRAFCRETGLR